MRKACIVATWFGLARQRVYEFIYCTIAAGKSPLHDLLSSYTRNLRSTRVQSVVQLQFLAMFDSSLILFFFHIINLAFVK